MEWDAFFEFLGAGGGLIVLLRWISELPSLIRKIKEEKKEASLYITERDNETIKELYDKVRMLQERLSSLEGCLAKLVGCPQYNRCPARQLVQDYKREYYYLSNKRPRVEQKGKRYPRDNTLQSGGTNSPIGQPP